MVLYVLCPQTSSMRGCLRTSPLWTLPRARPRPSATQPGSSGAPLVGMLFMTRSCM